MGGFTVIGVDKSAATAGLASQQMVDLINAFPSALPNLQGGLNLRLGVPAFLFFDSVDLGLRTASFAGEMEPQKGFLIGTQQQDWGVDLRGNVFEAGFASPITLTLGIGFDSYRGKLWMKNPNLQLNDTSVSGYTATGTIDNELDVDMDSNSYKLSSVVSRKFLFFNPYFGLAFQVNSGTTQAKGFQSGTVTITGPGSPSTSSSSATVEGSTSAPVSGMDIRFGGGFELDFVFAYLALGGEYGAISGAYGGNIQIGGKFR
jgi:hypothetical protein